MIVSTRHLETLRRQYGSLESQRKELQRLSSEIQRSSKQAIFARQRDDVDAMMNLFVQLDDWLEAGSRIAAMDARLGSDGTWRAALEEYAEAVYFDAIISVRDPKFPEWLNDPTILLAGLSDAVGELVRYAIRCATFGRSAEIYPLAEQAEGLVEFLSSMDLTGSLRTKADQARQHLRRMEEVRYDTSRSGH